MILLSTIPQGAAQMTLALSPSVPSPAPVGTVVTWTASASAASDPLWYRFRVRRLGFDFEMVKDFGPENTFDWTAADYDGAFEIEAVVRNLNTGESAVAAAPFVMQPIATTVPVVTPTHHPLVFLYSAPPCDEGSRMRVRFQSPEGFTQYTPYKDCRVGSSMNFYLGGLRASTEYWVYHTIDTGDTFVDGPVTNLITGTIAIDIPEHTVLQSVPFGTQYPILLQDVLFANPLATDLDGNVVWYYPYPLLSFLTRPSPGGRFLGLMQDMSGDPARQLLLEFDLTGRTVLQTNAARVNEQLAAMGKRLIDSFHHEARRLPDGRILTLAGVEQILSDVQGPGPVNILGDMIIVLTPDLQVLWTWDTFDHLDPRIQATLGDICAPGVCPPLRLAPRANDWTHGNSVAQTPEGNLLLSLRSLDWVLKIDYRNGNGTGDVLWKLGKNGDFQLSSTDPSPWFSHQHDPQFEPGSTTRISLLDNGNTRHEAAGTGNSRGQVIQIDEKNRTATLPVNVDLGGYSFALGSAQRLPNGNYHWEVGFLPDNSSWAVETDTSGKQIYKQQLRGPDYRSFRMRDLYSPPN